MTFRLWRCLMEMNPKPGLILNSYDLLQVVMMKMCGCDVCVIFVWRLDFFVCVWWSRHLPSGGETSLKLPLFLMIKSNNKREKNVFILLYNIIDSGGGDVHQRNFTNMTLVSDNVF